MAEVLEWLSSIAGNREEFRAHAGNILWALHPERKWGGNPNTEMFYKVLKLYQHVMGSVEDSSSPISLASVEHDLGVGSAPATLHNAPLNTESRTERPEVVGARAVVENFLGRMKSLSNSLGAGPLSDFVASRVATVRANIGEVGLPDSSDKGFPDGLVMAYFQCARETVQVIAYQHGLNLLLGLNEKRLKFEGYGVAPTKQGDKISTPRFTGNLYIPHKSGVTLEIIANNTCLAGTVNNTGNLRAFDSVINLGIGPDIKVTIDPPTYPVVLEGLAKLNQGTYASKAYRENGRELKIIAKGGDIFLRYQRL
jgi:hypothetical protein